MDFLKNAAADFQKQQNQHGAAQHPPSQGQHQGNSGGLMGALNGAFGGGRSGEDREGTQGGTFFMAQ